MEAQDLRYISWLLRDLRKKAQLPLAKVAELAEVDADTLEAWEVGESRPDRDACLRLARVFLVDPDMLTEGAGWGKASVSYEHMIEEALMEAVATECMPDGTPTPEGTARLHELLRRKCAARAGRGETASEPEDWDD